MPLRFDLSGASENATTHSRVTTFAAPMACGLQPASTRVLLHKEQHHALPQPPAQKLTFTIGASSHQAGLVRRFADPVLQRFGIGATPLDDTKCQRADDDANDQYTIRGNQSMCWAVLFKNNTGKKHPKSLLGDFGHAERLPAWIHLISGTAFGIYAAIRPVAITKEHTAAELWTTMSASAVSFCFLSSTIYHITSPSEKLAFFTRQLDYTGIYTAIAVGSVADYAIATRSFQNVSILSIIDGPLAALFTCAFFLFRRGLLPSSDTWSSYLGGCTVTFGLFRRMHIDKAHTGARQATSFLLVISSFVTTPSLFINLGLDNALVIIGLELGCLFAVVLGIFMDNAFVWPDVRLANGKGPLVLVCKPCGCIGSAHSFWHILSVVAAVKGAIGREFALSC